MITPTVQAQRSVSVKPPIIVYPATLANPNSSATVMPPKKGRKATPPTPTIASLPVCDASLPLEGRVAFAAGVHHDQRDKLSFEQVSITKLAENYNIPRTTLQDRLNGKLPKAQSNAAKSHFTEAESEKLIDLIRTTADQGFPLTIRRLQELANHLLLAKHCGMVPPRSALDPSTIPLLSSDTAAHAPQVGQNWAERWLKKYDTQVRKYYARGLDRNRANAVNPQNIAHWYDLLHEVQGREQFTPDLIFGMDETCGWGDTSERQQVLGGSGKRTQAAQRSMNRESTTLIVATSAVGVALRPYAIFKGTKVKASWSQKNPLDAK